MDSNLLELCLDSFLPKFLILLPSDKSMTFWPLIFLLPKIFKIFSFSNILALSVLDEGYSRNESCALNLLSMFLLNLLNFLFFQDVSVSNWHLMVFSCDFNGTVVATYYPAVFGEKKPHRSKLVSIIENSCLGNLYLIDNLHIFDFWFLKLYNHILIHVIL